MAHTGSPQYGPAALDRPAPVTSQGGESQDSRAQRHTPLNCRTAGLLVIGPARSLQLVIWITLMPPAGTSGSRMMGGQGFRSSLVEVES
jgi:hypothetical protein